MTVFVSADRCRALRHADAAQCASLAERVGRAWQAWCEAWYPAATVSIPQAIPADGPPVDRDLVWFHLGDLGQAAVDSQIWLALPAAMTTVLVDAWFDTAQPTPLSTSLAHGVADRAVADLQVRLGAALALDASTAAARRDATRPADAMYARWSGAVALDWRGPAGDMRLLVGGAAVRVLHPRVPAAAAPAGGQISALGEAVGHSTIRLTAAFEPIELTVGELSALQPGDAITLGHRLDQPIGLTANDGRRVCAGLPGRQGEQRALRLVAVTDLPRP